MVGRGGKNGEKRKTEALAESGNRLGLGVSSRMSLSPEPHGPSHHPPFPPVVTVGDERSFAAILHKQVPEQTASTVGITTQLQAINHM